MSDSTDLLAPVDDEPAAGGVEPRELRPYQKEAADAAEDMWREGYERTSVVLPTGSGKPVADHELVPTPDRGFVRMSDLRVGDYVFGSDGEPTRIVHVDPQGVIPLRRVHFDDGSSVVAGAGHLWEIKRKGRFPRVETTDWIRKQGYQDRDGYMWRLPIIDPVNYPARDLPLDPYLMGTLIANGSMKTGPIITTPDTHVIDELERRGVFLNKHQVDEKWCPRWGVPGIRDVLRELGMWDVGSRDKRIPRVYLEAPDTARLDLLRGLMDGDGSSRGGGRRVCKYHTTSPGLSDDVAELVWSLGGRAKQHTTDRRHEDKPIEYEVGILMPEGISPFLSPRKVRDEHPRRTFKPRRAIVDIEDVADGPATCIQVDAEDGLFAVTDRYVLTHNSSVIAELARRAVRRGQRVVALAHRDELINQMRDTYSLVAPELEPGGIVKAEIDEHDRDFVCASFQTLAASPKRVEKLGVRNLILVDECHHALAPSYMRVLYDLGLTVPKPRGNKKTNQDGEVFGDHVPQVGSKSKKASDYITQFDHVPEIRACGFTATMSRSDSEQLGKVWSTVAFERDISWAIDNGYLITPRSLTVHVPELKGLGNVKTVAGDFNSKQLAEVMEASVESTVDAIQRHAKDRNMIVFAASVNHAEELAAALTIEGIPAGVVVGSSSREVREDTYFRFNSGELQALITVMVLTEGADFPRCDCVVMARPTRSQVLFCFDDQTEILTDQGWVKGTDMRENARVAAYDTDTGKIEWEKPQRWFSRPLEDGERMVSLSSPTVDMRVTENHRMVWRRRNDKNWRVSEAGDLISRKSQYVMPFAGVQNSSGIDLTDDEIRFVAWVMTDGYVSKNGLAVISQQDPENCRQIESMLDSCGFKWNVVVNNSPTNFGPRKNPLHNYRVCRGKPRGTQYQHLRGWGELGKYIPKYAGSSAYRLLERMDARQWSIFLEVFHRANGAKQANTNGWTRRGYHLFTPFKEFADWTQSMCVRRGWRCNVALDTAGRDRPLYAIHCREVAERYIGGSGQTDRKHLEWSPTKPGEQVWCVTVSTGATIVRRNGKAMVSGNCQMVGRSLRHYTDPHTGKKKEDALVLDLSGAAADATLSTLTDLWPDAEDEEFDNDGHKLETPSDAEDEQEAAAFTQQRRGTIELEAVDLLRRAASSNESTKKGPPHRRVVALSTAGGVMFIPSSRGGAGMMLWPPHPNRVQNVCVIKFSNYGRVAHPMLDAEGNIMVSNYAVMYDLACRAAYEGKDENDRRTAIMRRAQWRQPGKRPSQKQLDLARKMNAPVPAGASMADVSDAISREFMQANLANMLPQLRQWGLVE